MSIIVPSNHTRIGALLDLSVSLTLLKIDHGIRVLMNNRCESLT